MGAPALHQGAMVQCPHGVPAQAVPSQVRVTINKQPVLTQQDMFTVGGCPFQLPGPTPSPCVQVKWLTASVRVKASGVPVLLQTSTSLCLAGTQAPQGPAVVAGASPRVTAL
ncbi:MAG: PAAR-like protein [Polyangiaceae bacterium]